ncbi:MAG TPA: RNA polymerase sigma factor RpoH [Acidiferrobacteraceae bacterium]|nr:RNA polymerase sigma factor RpoH [Acidiferrobacteraceae bacterium]
MSKKQLVLLPAGLQGDSGLASYIRIAQTAPILSIEEERVLAVRFREDGDLEAAKQLVLSQLRNVIHVARKFSGYGLPQADLIQEGNIGLMKAVKQFDPQRRVRLISFAIHWIRAEMFDYILQNWRLVKIATTKSQRKLFFNLRKRRRHLGWMTRQEVDGLAKELDVDRETVLQMESRMNHSDTPFEADDNDLDNPGLAPAGYLQDMRYNPEQLVSAANQVDNNNHQIATALSNLDARSRDIVQRRWLNEDKPTLHELAGQYGVSAERVRQIEKKALASMKDILVA